jgi:flagellar L-ring protein precursor FlgH
MNYVVQRLLLVVVGVILAGCNSTTMERLNEVGKPPKMEPTQAPMRKDDYSPVQWPKEKKSEVAPMNVNSLWQPGNSSFFKDQRARQIGDIVKVTIKIKDKAELDNATDRSRDTTHSLKAGSLFGLQELVTGWLPGKADPTSLLNTTAADSNKGKGSIQRQEKIETEVAAMVTQILPNGNLVIQGDQEIRVNYELRKITVSGIVRPADLGADNSIDSNLIAESRISYGGHGQIMDVQQPRIGDQVLDVLSPF